MSDEKKRVEIDLSTGQPKIVTVPATTIEEHISYGGTGGGVWGEITGTLSNQTDLQTALNAKATDVDLTILESKTLPEAGAQLIRQPELQAIYDDLLDTSNPIDIIVIGDSIAETGFADYLYQSLATRYNAYDSAVTVSPVIGTLVAQSGALRPMNGTIQGSANDDGFAAYGTSLTNGQSASTTNLCDGLIVIWAEGTGTLTVKDGGSGGTTVATIDTTTGDGFSNLTSIDLGSYASHEIWIGSTGNTHLEGVQLTVGNRTRGVRVWNAAHTSYNSSSGASGVNTDGYFKDFTNHLKALTGREPHFIISTGTNDAVGDYTSRLTTLVQDVKALTDGSIILWSPTARQSNGIAAKSYLARAIAASEEVGLVDSGKEIGDLGADYYNLSTDGVHPGLNGSFYIGASLLIAITNDIIGSIMTLSSQTYSGGADVNRTTLGRLLVGLFFGFPVLELYGAASETAPEVRLLNSQVSVALGHGDYAMLSLGAGGSTQPDTFIHRSAAGELSVRASTSALGEILTNRIRRNAGTPESSVTAPVGAICQDTTNGELYVKASGTGNTGWVSLAKTVAPTFTTTIDLDMDANGRISFGSLFGAPIIFMYNDDGDANAGLAISSGGFIFGAGGASAPDVQITRTGANILSLGAGDKLQQNEAPTTGDDLVNKTYADTKLASSAYDDATAAETNTGTSTAKYVSPDGLAGSYAGTKSVSIQVTDGTTNVTTGDGKAYITIPEALNGMNLVRAQATVVTAGTTNATTVMIHNKTGAADMLSGAISIASGGTVGTVGTINASEDDVATNDVIRIDVDSVSTTAPQGLMVILEFRLP